MHRTPHTRTAGAAMAEFALVIGVVMMTLVAIIAFGQALYAYHFTANAAREASRYAMVRGASCTSFASACPASASDIQSYVQSLAPSSISSSAVTATTTWAPDDNPGSSVTVTVNYSMTVSIPFLSPATLNLASTSETVITQ